MSEPLIKDINVDRQGYSASDLIYFTVIADRVLTDQEMYSMQTGLGYNPIGYGINGHTVETKGNDIVTVWSCAASTGD